MDVRYNSKEIEKLTRSRYSLFSLALERIEDTFISFLSSFRTNLPGSIKNTPFSDSVAALFTICSVVDSEQPSRVQLLTNWRPFYLRFEVSPL